MLELARSWLGITTPIVRASSLGSRGAEDRSDRSTCAERSARASTSRARGGSTGYLDVERSARAGVGDAVAALRRTRATRSATRGSASSRTSASSTSLFNCGPASRRDPVRAPAQPARQGGRMNRLLEEKAAACSRSVRTPTISRSARAACSRGSPRKAPTSRWRSSRSRTNAEQRAAEAHAGADVIDAEPVHPVRRQAVPRRGHPDARARAPLRPASSATCAPIS